MSKIRILIVEDEAVTAADLHDELIAQGYEVIGTTDTAEGALRLAEAGKPEMVLMDINLAGSADGIHAASAMRGAEIPVIFLTAHYDQRTLARAKKATPVGYISKPLEPHELSVAIEIGIERHRSDTERMRLLREIEHEREQVKILRGLLPICACCKKIRNDAGYWQSVESYISSHSDATFTHSYCPACALTVLGDLT
ncbi:MAG: response regulator [Chthoniobacteraceae bacterium]